MPERGENPGGGGQAFWSRDADDLLARLAARREGLEEEDAAERLRRFGVNAPDPPARLAPLVLFLKQFQSPLVLILLFGAAISMALRDWIEATIIWIIVVGSALLGFIQEYRASRTVIELRRHIALTATVLRGGKEATIPAAAIVPGDILLLAAGALVPADGLVLEAEDFLVNEAGLTGESFPVEKRPGVVAATAAPAARTNAVFGGSSVQSGTAKVLIVATGRNTAFGAIAARLRARPPETDFARGIRRFGYMLIQVMVVVVLFVLTVNQLLGRSPAESLLFAVALAVGLSPELLPAIIIVTLSAGARALFAKGVIVRRLEVIENLGSMDVLCTDKTGTLTEGVTALAAAIDPDGVPSPPVRELGFINAAFETGIGNPLDAALVAMGGREGLSTAGYRKVDEIPYDFRRKSLMIVVEKDDDPANHLIIVKGAFANILSRCTRIATAAGEVLIGDERKAALERLYAAKGAEGFRVIAVASRRVPARDRYRHEDEADLSFAGFLLFVDPPKEDAARTLRDLAVLGVAVKVVSGDNRFVTAHLAEAVGIDPAAMMTGDEIARTGDEALAHCVGTTTLFVEVDPQQKDRIVRALQRAGHTVGYLGDGINDAPALHAADVGISVAEAVDVARESADIILLERDLDVLRQGVAGGRRTFANTLKYINITTSANFGNMISMALATPFLPFLPLLPMQILLNNFLSDLPSAAISTDNVDQERVERPQAWNVGSVQRFMIVFGLTSSVFDGITFALLLFVVRADAPTFRTAWFVVSLLTELAVVLVLRTRRPAWRSRPGTVLLWTTAAAALGCLAIPYLGSLSALFGFTPIPIALLAATLAIVAGYVAATELAKAWFYRRIERDRRAP